MRHHTRRARKPQKATILLHTVTVARYGPQSVAESAPVVAFNKIPREPQNWSERGLRIDSWSQQAAARCAHV